jgi:uncharacterized protein YecE (DUF72 family)
VLFQLGPWLKFSDESLAYLGTLPRCLPDSVIAVEFRNRSWFGEHTDETLKFLKDHGLTYVSSRSTVRGVEPPCRHCLR